MIAYLFRRLFYGALILLGVNLLTFLLFFAVNTPDDMARLALGGKRVSVESIRLRPAALLERKGPGDGKRDEDDLLDAKRSASLL